MGLRVKDAGKSECRFVMKRIGIQDLSHAKAGRLPMQVARYEKMRQTVSGEKADGGDE